MTSTQSSNHVNELRARLEKLHPIEPRKSPAQERKLNNPSNQEQNHGKHPQWRSSSPLNSESTSNANSNVVNGNDSNGTIPAPLPTRPPLPPKPAALRNNNHEPEQQSPSGSSTVREKARMFESVVGLFGQQRGESVTSPAASSEPSTHSNVTSPVINRRVSRPTSLISANTSDSSPDDERDSQPRLSIDTFSGMDSINSRSSFNADPVLHNIIIEQLREKGLLIKSKIPPKRPPPPQTTNSNSGEIPKDVGKLRPAKESSNNLSIEGGSSSRVESGVSIASDRSSSLTSQSDDAVPDYNTGDPDEDKRLKQLHYAAAEFLIVQKNFVAYLEDMVKHYPIYIEQYGRTTMNKDLLTPHANGTDHVVVQIQKLLSQILPFHKLLQEEFNAAITNWNSENPKMADIIIKFSDILKSCTPFLLKKAQFVEEMSNLRRDNKDFDQATLSFEQHAFNRGSRGAIVQQLDQVHQNFMRYKILMLRYNNYLKEGSEEAEKGKRAVDKLEEIAQKVNKQMGLPSNEHLFQLYDRFQGQFDVFFPGRHLIREGEVLKQTRRDTQSRYLVLFTDCIWLCRIYSSIGSGGMFDMAKSYKMDIDKVSVECRQHEDYDRHLLLKSKTKSATLIFPSAKECQDWYRDIQMLYTERRKYKRRQSEAISRAKRNHTLPVILPSPSCNCTGECVCEMRPSFGPIPDTELESTRQSTLREETSSPASASSQEDVSIPNTPAEETTPINESSLSQPKKRVKKEDIVKPVWIPDDSSRTCLMEGCSTTFSLVHRRHHCRDCGWLICSQCKGKAPLLKYNFESQNVCPECYERIEAQYKSGTLFPQNKLSQSGDGRILLSVKKKNGTLERIDPSSLFSAPLHRGFRRRDIESRISRGLIFGRVFVRTKKNQEIVRYAELADGLVLKFYKAEFDREPLERHIIHGFQLHETQIDGGTLFELTHQNQITTTDARQTSIMFRVESEKSANRWSSALSQLLSLQ
ncbi:hypothetical protein WR25_05537 [Diploscapter pachys]|uniref:FYVE, RhoGEF and PH domain-containing protein 6 n=1 Tax=Diploscapter pachys TaxID=2018661 RepID=A0A2A2JL18_9BILA|nr:hypothetical protein WR25_05537 [Diploscapter pachys]